MWNAPGKLFSRIVIKRDQEVTMSSIWKVYFQAEDVQRVDVYSSSDTWDVHELYKGCILYIVDWVKVYDKLNKHELWNYLWQYEVECDD